MKTNQLDNLLLGRAALLCAVLSLAPITLIPLSLAALPYLQRAPLGVVELLLALLAGLALCFGMIEALTMEASKTVRKRWRRRYLWALLAMSIATATPVVGFYLHDFASPSLKDPDSGVTLAAKPYLYTVLVHVAAPALVAVLWYCHRRRADRRQNGPRQ